MFATSPVLLEEILDILQKVEGLVEGEYSE